MSVIQIHVNTVSSINFSSICTVREELRSPSFSLVSISWNSDLAFRGRSLATVRNTADYKILAGGLVQSNTSGNSSCVFRRLRIVNQFSVLTSSSSKLIEHNSAEVSHASTENCADIVYIAITLPMK